MRVRLECESEMTDIVRRVFRVRHGAQQRHGYCDAIGPLPDFFEKLVQLPWLHVIGVRDFQAKAQQILANLLEFVRVRFCMHPVQAGYAMPLEEPGCLHVGSDHALFYQAVRIVSRHGTDTRHFAFGIHVYPGLRNVELERSAPPANFRKQPVNVVQAPHIFLQRLRNRSLRLSR